MLLRTTVLDQAQTAGFISALRVSTPEIVDPSCWNSEFINNISQTVELTENL